ncbi:hypothetical protein ACTA71_006463 [Dictyostelium dimigraforme]
MSEKETNPCLFSSYERWTDETMDTLFYFFSQHILTEIEYTHKIIIDTLKREIVIGDSILFDYLIEFNPLGPFGLNYVLSSIDIIKATNTFFKLIVPDIIIKIFLQIQPYSFLLNWLKNFNSNYYFTCSSITSIFNRIVEMDKAMYKRIIKQSTFSKMENYNIKVIGDDKIGLSLIHSKKSTLLFDAYILTYNIGDFLSFLKISSIESFYDDYEKLIRCFNYERTKSLRFKIQLSDILQELNYSRVLFSKPFINNQRKQKVENSIIELQFCVDLPIIQFIHEIKSLNIDEKEILKQFINVIIEMSCIVYKLQSIKLKRNHQHHLTLDKNKQFSYRNLKKLFIFSKIENFKKIIKALSPIYSHDMETTNFIKSYFNDKTMYSKKDIENLNQDISWCDDIILRVNLIGNLEIIKYYQKTMENGFNFSNKSTIINFKNKSVDSN